MRLLWLVIAACSAIGFTRLQFDPDVLNLLPGHLTEVTGLKLYQSHFDNGRELIITVSGDDPSQVLEYTQTVAGALRGRTNLIGRVRWQAPWTEDPKALAQFVAYLWFNGPPEMLHDKTERLSPGNIQQLLRDSLQVMTTSFSPEDIARIGYDPFGFLDVLARFQSTSAISPGTSDPFASADGTFRILKVLPSKPQRNYKETQAWVSAVRSLTTAALREQPGYRLQVLHTGAPAFASDISVSMEQDMKQSVFWTAAIIAGLFWVAHRRLKPLLWLLLLLLMINVATLGLGGLLFGSVNVVSFGFSAILMGLAVDYALVHYQEAKAHPHLTIPEVRRMMAPGIFWAAFTTVGAFLLLNFGGLPGLAQLGSLVAIGVALAALVMVFEYLPLLFPERNVAGGTAMHSSSQTATLGTRKLSSLIPSTGVVIGSAIILVSGLPDIETSAEALRPSNSEPHRGLELIRELLSPAREDYWLIVKAPTAEALSEKLVHADALLGKAKDSGLLAGYSLPSGILPNAENQSRNRAQLRTLLDRKELLSETATALGFDSKRSLAFSDTVLSTLNSFTEHPSVRWPAGKLGQFLMEEVIAAGESQSLAAGMITGTSNNISAAPEFKLLKAELYEAGVYLSSWESLGQGVFQHIRPRAVIITMIMCGAMVVSLWLAFRRVSEVMLGVGSMVLGVACLLATMKVAGWSWNLINLMAIPLILGTGVDYGIFIQRELRRNGGDYVATWKSIGKALLLCGATGVAGFGSLGLSTNTGLSSLGRVCAAGMAWNVAIAVLLLPAWWRFFAQHCDEREGTGKPSRLYTAGVWRLGRLFIRLVPRSLAYALAQCGTKLYRVLAPARFEVVRSNLARVNAADSREVDAIAGRLFSNFGRKVVDLWRYEAGLPIEHSFGESTGWEHYLDARKSGKGVLIVTIHLGNWEFGGPWLVQKGVALEVVSQAEPGRGFTEARSEARARWNIKTLLVRNDPFAFLEIVRRLDEGATVALLIDRPPPSTISKVSLFGVPFNASIAPAELARATGCAILPVIIPRVGTVYEAHILPPICYDRAALRSREARAAVTSRIMQTFEPFIARYLDQWYHFVPIWPKPDHLTPTQT